jgi:AcrR family transcriptional regulator
MGRPPLHRADDFLDAAARLFANGGVRALTMNAVARDIGAPSGSIYHRFSDRAALLAALWLRTARGFQGGYLEILGERPTPGTAVDAAVWTVDWCREHLDEAVVLQAGAEAFEPDQWSPSARAEMAALDDELRRRMGHVVRALANRAKRPNDQVAFAMLDLPLAAVRRHLRTGEPPPKRASKLVRDLASLIVGMGTG